MFNAEYVLAQWKKYFPDAELPVGVFYANDPQGVVVPEKPKDNPRGYTCFFAQIAKLHHGVPLAFSFDNLGCWGAITNIFGGPFNEDATTHLLCDIEKFKKSAEEVLKLRDISPKAKPKGKWLILKPLDKLSETDEPDIFICFGAPDVIAALHTLANYDDTRMDTVICPHGSGCEVAIKYAMAETYSEKPRCVLGGMDVAMRGCMRRELLTFSIPAKRFYNMAANMDDSFLDTYIWKGLKKGTR